jgi:hypothetical protein
MGPLGSTQQVQGVIDGAAGYNVRVVDADTAVAMGDCIIGMIGGPAVLTFQLPTITPANLGGRIMFANFFGNPTLDLDLVAAVGAGQAGFVIVGNAFGPNFLLDFVGALVLVAVDLPLAGGYLWSAESTPGADGAPGPAGPAGPAGPPGPGATGGIVSTHLFTVVGAGAWVVPAGVQRIEVEGVAGGGGSSGYSGGAGLEQGGGAGGGGGGYFRILFTGLVPGDVFNWVVGAGGAAGTATGAPGYTATPGGTGGVTSWEKASAPTTHTEAFGGEGGDVLLVSGASRIAKGGGGGQVIGGFGPMGRICLIQGGQGGNAMRLYQAPANFAYQGGHGGTTPLGGSHPGPVGGATASASPGIDNYGAGAAGGSDPGGTSQGAAGHAGYIFVTAYS